MTQASQKTPSTRTSLGWGIACLAVVVGLFFLYGLSAYFVVFALLSALLAVAAAYDATAYRIPNKVVLAILVLWLAWVAYQLVFRANLGFILMQSLFGALAAAGPVLLLTAFSQWRSGSPAFGAGDIKLLAAVGLFFTWDVNFFALLIAAIVGAVIGVVQKIRHGKKKVPFGCGIAVGWWVIMLLAPWHIMLL